MGIAAKQFHNTEDRENTLAYRIKPSDKQIETQKDRWNDLAGVVLEGLRDKFGKHASSWLQGSYKFSTQIRPARLGEEFDIDLGVYLEWIGASEDGDIDPLDLKNQVQKILVAYADDPNTDAVKVDSPKTRCNRIIFTDAFHIDVPSYHLDRDADRRSLATEENIWESDDPKAIYVWWKAQHTGDDRDRARRLVRYLKMWAALKFEPVARPSSILLTVLVADALTDLNAAELSGDDEFLEAILEKILTRLQQSSIVKNPANEGEEENLNGMRDADFKEFLRGIEDFLDVARVALAAEDALASSEAWSEAFAHFFPLPEVGTEDIQKAADQAHLLRFGTGYDPDVEITASAGSLKWKRLNAIGPIPRGSDLTFRVTNVHALPEDATIEWTVRNNGAEAEALNDMGHVNQAGPTSTESSAYKGIHYMDVAIKLAGRIVGRRRIKVNVNGQGVPKRNSRRPNWNSLRR